MRESPAGRIGGEAGAAEVAAVTTDGAELAGSFRRDEARMRSLALAARDGSEDAFAALYEAYAANVYRYCLARVHAAHDAEDLLQQTFLRVVEALPNYEDRGLPLGAWLFRIARTVTIDHHRRRRYHQPISELEPGYPAAAWTGGDAMMEEVVDALERLTDDQRQVIQLRFFADLSARDAGLVMGRDEAAIRALQARAIAAIRRALEAGPGGVRASLPVGT
jgi:RNA polymerase sigma-70 factor, ECF subfamily